MPPENETRRLAKKIASAVPRLAKAANKKAAGPTKANTGRKDSQGRTIWEGPRGGLFVMNGDKKITIAKQPNQVVPSRPRVLPPWTVLKAVHKFKGGIFQDPITMQSTAKKHGIVLNRTRYSKASMARWIGDKPHHRQTVPHSRRPITNEERRIIFQGQVEPIPQTTRIHVRVIDHGHVNRIPGFSVPPNTPMTMVSRIFAQKYRDSGLNGSDAEYAMYLRYRGNTIPLNRNGSDVLDRYRDPETRYVIIDAVRV